MATLVLGAGFSPAGESYAAFGSPATADDYDPTLSTGNARMIDPETGNFLVDGSAKPYLMTTAQEMVLLAFKTRQGSSIVKTLGQNFGSIKMITSNVQILIRNEVSRCLAYAIDNGFIELLEVNVKFTSVPGRLGLEVIFKDVGSNTVQTYLLET